MGITVYPLGGGGGGYGEGEGGSESQTENMKRVVQSSRIQ